MINRRSAVSCVLGVAGLTAFAVKRAPMFWQRLSEDRKREVAPAPFTPDLRAWPKTGLHAAWIGHSTVFLSIDGYTIVTDPVFATRIGVSIGGFILGMKRLVQPAVALENLPTPDLILLSHAHMDHFDLPTLKLLENRHTRVITALKTSDLVRAKRYQSVRELSWNETAQVGPATIRAIEVNHWGARVRNDTQRGYNGYVIEAGRYRVLFAGDTAYTESFRKVRTSKPVDLAIMPIGAYDPWIRVHCNPEQALTMANQAGAEAILPVHHRTFELSREPRAEPLERLLAAAGSATERICIRDFGQEFHA